MEHSSTAAEVVVNWRSSEAQLLLYHAMELSGESHVAGPLGALVGGYSDAEWLYDEASRLETAMESLIRGCFAW